MLSFWFLWLRSLMDREVEIESGLSFEVSRGWLCEGWEMLVVDIMWWVSLDILLLSISRFLIAIAVRRTAPGGEDALSLCSLESWMCWDLGGLFCDGSSLTFLSGDDVRWEVGDLGENC